MAVCVPLARFPQTPELDSAFLVVSRTPSSSIEPFLHKCPTQRLVEGLGLDSERLGA